MSKAIRPWSPQEKEFISNNIRADFETGILYWKKDQLKRKVAAKAGDPVNAYLMNPKARQYYYLALYYVLPDVKQTNYRVHHVIYFLRHGVQPMQIIDHINGNPLDNSADNLRMVTPSQNLQNSQKHRITESNPFKGAHRRKGGKKFVCTICKDGLTTRLGSFDAALDAALAYDRAAICLNGVFASLNFPDVTHTPQQLKLMRDYLAMKRNKQPVSQAA